MASWMTANDVTDLTTDHQEQLFEDLGLVPYLAKDICTLSSDVSVEHSGWTKGKIAKQVGCWNSFVL